MGSTVRFYSSPYISTLSWKARRVATTIDPSCFWSRGADRSRSDPEAKGAAGLDGLWWYRAQPKSPDLGKVGVA